MRMDERGLGTGALVGIIVGVVVAVVVPVTVVAVVLGVGGGGGSVPAYAGASYLKTVTADSTTITYYDLGSINGGTVYNWYKIEMANAGWSVYEYSQYAAGSGGTLVCSRGNEQAGIQIIEDTYTVAQINAQQGINASKILGTSYAAGTPSGGNGGQPC